MTRAGVSDAAEGPTSTIIAPSEHPEAVPAPAPRVDTAAGPDRETGWPSRRTYTLLLLLAVVAGLGVRALFVPGNQVASADETDYLTSGLRLWSGHGFTTLAGTAETHFPPGLPFLLGGIHRVLGGDPHTATLLVGLFSTTVVVLPLAGIARLIAGRRAGVLAAWIAALSPALVLRPLYSGSSAGPFTLLAVTALWLALRSPSWSPRRALLGSAACGLAVAGAYLIRPEGIFYAVVLLPTLALAPLGGWRGLRRARRRAPDDGDLAVTARRVSDGGARSWRRAGGIVAAFVLPVMLLVAPYSAYLHRHTGSWELTAKAQGVTLPAWRAVAKDNRREAHAIMYQLDKTGYRFRRSDQPLSTLVRDDPDGYLGIVGVNLNHLYAAAFNTSIVPFPNWSLLPGVLFLLAVFAAWRRRHDRAVLAVLAAIAVPVASAIAFFVIPRYLIPSAALVCVLAAVGLLELPQRWFRAATITALLLVLSSTGAGWYSQAHGWFHPVFGFPEHKAAGEWIGKHSQPNDLIMSTNVVPGYYAQRKTVPIPYASKERIIDFGRHYGARYLIVDQAHGLVFRPQLRPLGSRNPLKTIRAVYRVTVDERRTVVYELVPRPPPFEGRVPLLNLSEYR